MGVWSAVGAIGGAAIGAGGSLAAGAASARASKRAYQHRYQWTVEDLKKAGLNPMLAVSNGAPQPNIPAMPNVGESAVRGAEAGARSVQSARVARAQIENMQADTQLKGSATALNIASARESSIRSGISEASLPWAPMSAQASALSLDKNVAIQNAQLQKLGEEIKGLKLSNEQQEQLRPMMIEAQRLINAGMSADLVRKEVYGRLWSVVPDQDTLDHVLNLLKSPGDWPRRISEWGKEYVEKRRPVR